MFQKIKMVNVPKARNTYCAKCNKHQKMKVGRGNFPAEDPADLPPPSASIMYKIITFCTNLKLRIADFS